MRKPIYVVDAFAERALQGNPAGVLLDGADLNDTALQQIAAEMKHSETAFPLPARDPHASFHLRWFTPTSEVVFCGHATLAALTVLAGDAKRIRVPETGVARVTFGCKAGLMRAELSRDSERRLQIRFETPATTLVPTQVTPALLTALGLIPEVLDPRIPPHLGQSSVEGGNLYLCVRDRETLARVRPDQGALGDALAAAKVGGLVPYCLQPAPGIDAALRGFFPNFGVPEDPVTGSASGELAVLLQTVLPEELPRKLVFTQGDEVSRPGRVLIELRPEATPGKVRAWIGGAAQVVLRGELEL